MDSRITKAARALSAGDPLGAVNQVALHDDAPSLALRGIALAQLGDLPTAKLLLKRASRVFGTKAPVEAARCVVAIAEIALASRDLHWPLKTLDGARATLEKHGDRANAAHAGLLKVRRLLLIGRLDEAERTLAKIDRELLPPALRAAYELAVAGIALRRLHTNIARNALAEAAHAASGAGIPALQAEVETAALVLEVPAARKISQGRESLLRLGEVEELLSRSGLIVDACRFEIRECGTVVSLTTRPVLFSLARALAEAWPNDVRRDILVLRAFHTKTVNESDRVRLRVEIGRLRKKLRGFAEVTATKTGFLLTPLRSPQVLVLAWPVEEAHSSVLALLADGESWSSSALALALGSSQRTVQRALESLLVSGKVQTVGQGRARRWMTPSGLGFTTILLLPSPLPNG